MVAAMTPPALGSGATLRPAVWTATRAALAVGRTASGADHAGNVSCAGAELRVLVPGGDFPPDLSITCVGFDAVDELVIGAAGAVALRRDGTWMVIRGLDATSSFAPTIDEIASSPGVV